MKYNLSERTWVALRRDGWSPKNINRSLPSLEEVLAQGSLAFAVETAEDGFEVIQNWAKKKRIKVFPVGGRDSTLLVADTGALYEADTDFEYIWKWGDSIEEGLENLLVTWKRSDETRISDAFGNIVDF
jgi:hypothetical protein